MGEFETVMQTRDEVEGLHNGPIEQQLGAKQRKLIQDGETYVNVSYYAWVHCV